MKELHFVSELVPGQQRDRREASNIRSHVRRAVLKDRRQADIGQRLKTYNVKYNANRDGQAKVNDARKNRSAPQLQPQLTVLHPYTTAATALLPLPISRVDGLFKGPFFQRATEPLFSVHHVDSESCMDAAFPGCLESPSFMYALLYSIVQMQNRGRPSFEALQLHGLTINNLRKTVRHSETYADVGAIMVLQGAAYRWNDAASHTAHTNALCTIRLSRRGGKKPIFTDFGRRALFWQDLFASLLMNSDRHETHLNLIEVHWRREEASPRRSFLDLPRGFLQHRNKLSEDLIDCIEDITELQYTVRSTKDPSTKRRLLSNMQASIESRLASCASDSSSAIIRCCSLALLITSFLSFTDTWRNTLIPCRLSEMLRTALYASLTSPEWSSHRSLQMWCYLVGSTVTPLNDGYVEALNQSWEESSVLFRCLDVPWSKYTTSAVQDFFYVERLMNQRMRVSAWACFEEEAVSSCTEEIDIGGDSAT